MMSTHAASLHELLHEHAGALKALLTKADKIAQIDALVNPFLPEKLRGECKIVNYEDKILVLGLKTGVFATELRLLAPQLCTRLKTLTVLLELQAIRVKVLPCLSTKTAAITIKPKPRLSINNQALLQQFAASLDDGRLKRALLHLAQTGPSETETLD